MKKFKMTLNRPILSSEEIQVRQDFMRLIHDSELLRENLWLNQWYFDTSSLSSVKQINNEGICRHNKGLSMHEI